MDVCRNLRRSICSDAGVFGLNACLLLEEPFDSGGRVFERFPDAYLLVFVFVRG